MPRRPRKKFHPAVYASILKKQRCLCACGCKEKFAGVADIQWDHIHPLADGGEDAPENLQALKVHHHKHKTKRESKDRAKERRTIARGGMTRKRLNQRDKALAKLTGMEP